MKHPRLSLSRRLVATVPALCDGLNINTDPSLIGDRQYSDSENMWWHRGALRCREGFYTDSSRWSWNPINENTRFFVDSDGWLLVLYAGNHEAGGELSVKAYDPAGNNTEVSWRTGGVFDFNGCFAPVGGEALSARFSALLFLSDSHVIGIRASQNRFEDITEEAYVPLRMSNAVPVSSRAEATPNGDFLEGYNRLTDKFRCEYTTNDVGVYYYMPSIWSQSELTVSLTLDGVTRVFSLNNFQTVSAPVDGFCLNIDRAASCFWFTKDGAGYPLAASTIRNNVKVTAQRMGLPESGGYPGQMRFGTWFGGDRSGLSGGTRLFLGGNEQGGVLWSDLNNPLYFPNGNGAVVGAPHQPVTAFGKQGSLLVAFKEREIYAFEYSAANTFTAADVQSGEVTDITATAVFTLTPLHAEIGCDLPHTVALCGNRLWWACRDGSVYVLQSTDQFSQRCVSRVSASIEPLLRKNGTPQFASGAVHDGRYYLLWNTDVLVATDTANPVWERFSTTATNTQPVTLLQKDGKLWLGARYPLDTTYATVWFTLEGTHDVRVTHTRTNGNDETLVQTLVPVRGMVCTKHYDFGTPERHKTVYRVFAEATAQGNVEVSYVTEHGEVRDLPHPSRAVEGLHTTPNGLRCRRLGVRFGGEQLQVGSVTLRLKE